MNKLRRMHLTNGAYYKDIILETDNCSRRRHSKKLFK